MRHANALLSSLLVVGHAAAGGLTGPGGIDSDVTGLDGTGVLIGMVENGRAGRPDYDTFFATVPHVNPAGIFIGASASQAPANQGIVSSPNNRVPYHATVVAEIINGSDASGAIHQGVVPNANLYSAGFGVNDPEGTLTLNAMAQRTVMPPLAGDRVRAINLSAGREIQPFIESLDGNSQVSKFIDWSAREHDVTYVIGWPNKNDGRTAPSDAYNGITVAPAKFVGMDLVQVAIDVMEDPRTDSDADGIRTSIHIMAPGEGIPLMQPEDDILVTANGSSFAAPHVTGAVAMLQQYAVEQIDAGNGAFHFRDSRRHQVMKAVLLNSADKFPGVHGSNRVAVNRDFTDWAGSAASNNPMIPLDQDFGAGMLNVRKAVEQYRSGETEPGSAGDVGWDHGRSGGIGDSFSYAFSESSKAGDYIAVTLAWDREVELTNPDDTFNQGDTFFDRDFEDSVNDLNLYLLEADENDTANAVARSTAADGTLEHIFFEVPAGGGDYKIVVEHEGSLFAQSDGVVANSIDTQTDFGVAWWAYEPSSVTPGDYDRNGVIELADYTEWTQTYGSTVFSGRGADGNLDGVIDAADYTVWRDAFAAAAFAVPEPTSVTILAFAVGTAFWRRQPPTQRGPHLRRFPAASNSRRCPSPRRVRRCANPPHGCRFYATDAAFGR